VKKWEWLRVERRNRLIDLHGGKCVACGYNNINVLHFHHIGPKGFSLGISQMHRDYEAVLQESLKCILVCPRCHEEEHQKLKRIDAEITQTLLDKKSLNEERKDGNK